MARLPDVLDDPSPLDTPGIDVRLRVGWMLRSCRVHGTAHHLTGAQFAAALCTTPASVTKWEKGTDDPDAGVVEDYERHTGLTPGSLRGIVDDLRRTFRHRVRDRAAPSTTVDLDILSRQVQSAMTGRPRGIDWMHFADALGNGTLALPDFVARPVVDRLVSETARAVGTAYMVRTAALAQLRRSAYHRVVKDSVLTFALDPDAQSVAEVMMTLAERPTASLMEQMSEQLQHPSLPVVDGACHTIIAAGASRGELSSDDVRRVARRAVDAYTASTADPYRQAVLADLLRTLPRGARRLLTDRGVPAPAPVPPPEQTHHKGVGYRAAEAAAARVTRRLGAREEPLLARTLAEAMFDPRPVKARAATIVLMALPYQDLTGEAVVELARRHPDQTVRRGAATLALALGGSGSPIAERWSHDRDRGRRICGLLALGRYAEDLDEDWLDVLAHDEDHEVARSALWAAGMGVRSSLLDKWVGDERMPSDLRNGAQWWAEQGGRVTDLDR